MMQKRVYYGKFSNAYTEPQYMPKAVQAVTAGESAPSNCTRISRKQYRAFMKAQRVQKYDYAKVGRSEVMMERAA